MIPTSSWLEVGYFINLEILSYTLSFPTLKTTNRFSQSIMAHEAPDVSLR